MADAATYFQVIIIHKVSNKNPAYSDGINRVLELLGRFELPTSSLPKLQT